MLGILKLKHRARHPEHSSQPFAVKLNGLYPAFTENIAFLHSIHWNFGRANNISERVRGGERVTDSTIHYIAAWFHNPGPSRSIKSESEGETFVEEANERSRCQLGGGRKNEEDVI